MRFLPWVGVLLSTLLPLTGCDRGLERESPEAPAAITWWSTNRAASFGIDMEELPVFREFQKRTGTAIDFRHPPAGQYTLRFRLMLASGHLPDIISHDFINDYPGGITAAVRDGIVLPLDESILKYAPNLMAYLSEHPDVAAELRLPDGGYFCFPSLNGERDTATYMGPFIRRDLLDRLGLRPPETLEEWEEVLARFAADPGIDIPLTFYGGNIRDTRFLIGTFGSDWSFYARDGEIVYGPAEPSFAAFVECLLMWYRNGWMDRGTLMNSRRAYEKTVESMTVGIYVDYVSNIETYERLLKIGNPEAELIPIGYPRYDRDAPPPPGHDSGVFIPFAAAYITPSAADPAEVARMLDYFWSEEGRRLFNFGIPGESYDMTADGPVFRDELFQTGGPGGYDYYIIAGPYSRDPESFLQCLRLPSQRNAIRLWSAGNDRETRLPLLLTDGNAEASLPDLRNSLDAYVFETVVDIIAGKTEIDRLYRLPADLEHLGLETALASFNALYQDR